jgi:hypothetical protein
VKVSGLLGMERRIGLHYYLVFFIAINHMINIWKVTCTVNKHIIACISDGPLNYRELGKCLLLPLK